MSNTFSHSLNILFASILFHHIGKSGGLVKKYFKNGFLVAQKTLSSLLDICICNMILFYCILMTLLILHLRHLAYY